MPLLTFGQVKASGISERVNMCATDSRFRDAVNRVVRWLLPYGNWWGTYRLARFCQTDDCLVMPGCVASLEAAFSCAIGLQIDSEWVPTHPGWNPSNCPDYRMRLQQFGTVPSKFSLCTPSTLRSFVGDSEDYGKTITFLGHDANGIWVRTRYNGAIQDGETVELEAPYADTTTVFSSVSAVRKDVTVDRVEVFSIAQGAAALTDFSRYEYWETTPSYQRYKVLACRRDDAECQSCERRELDCMVKMEFIPVQNDNDFLIISNLAAIEMGLEALKAKDDGDLALADAMLFGSQNNARFGAIPMLQQELRTYTADRTSFRVHIQGTVPLRQRLAGFI